MNNWRYKLTALMLIAVGLPAYAATATTTTLTVGPSTSVSIGTVMTLTAAVANPAVVTKGTVNFCDAFATVCVPGQGLLATAQLNSAGTATLKTRLGVGTHGIKAVFVPTTLNAGSASSVASVSVSGTHSTASTTTLTAGGSVGNYTLSGTVVAQGAPTLSGSVGFVDVTDGNTSVGNATLGTASYGFGPIASTTLTASDGEATGDLNGDGYPDLVVGGFRTSVSVMLGKGDGTFNTAVQYTTPNEPQSIAIADINGDGKPDIVTANGTQSNNVSVLLGNGDGTFQAPLNTAFPSNSDASAQAVSIADMNGDGLLDVIVASESGNQAQNGGSGGLIASVYVFLGNGDGTLAAPVGYLGGLNPWAMAVVDLNGDGTPDVVVGNGGNATYTVYLGKGDGTLQPAVSYSLPASVLGTMAVADFNGDGKFDLAFTGEIGTSGTWIVETVLGNGDGTFQTPISTPDPQNGYSVAVGDFNLDRKVDLIVGGPQLVMFTGLGDGTFGGTTIFNAFDGSSNFALSDLDGDGLLDVAVTNGNTKVGILLADQTASFTASGVSITGGSGSQSVIASFSGDTTRASSQSPPVSLTASKLTPTIALTASPTSGVYGGTVTLTATLGGADSLQPSGTVTFLDGSTSYGSATISGTTATMTTTLLPVGADSLTAAYGGDGNFATATSAAIPYTVAHASVALLVGSNEDPSTYGDAVTITVTVTGVSAIPTGSVVITDGGTAVGTATLNPSGVGTITISLLGAGTHNLVATYSGDSNYF